MNYELPPTLTRYGTELEEAIRRQLTAGAAPRSTPNPRRRGARLAVGASFVGMLVAGLVLLLTVTAATPPAYALTENQDGSVTVTMRDLATAIASVNAEFASHGIDETVIPITSGCKTPPVPIGGVTMSQSLTFVPGRKYLLPGYTGVVAAEQLPDGKVGMIMGALQPPLPTCFSTNPATVKPLGGGIVDRSADAASIAAQTLLTAQQGAAAGSSPEASSGQKP